MTMGQPHPNQSPEPAPEDIQEQHVTAEDPGETPSPIWSGFVGGRERAYQSPDEIARDLAASSEEALRLKAELDAFKMRFSEQKAPEPTRPSEPDWLGGMVEAGVPEPVARQLYGWVDQQTELRAAAKMEELLNGLSSLASQEAQADAALASDPTMTGYSKATLDSMLAQNPSFKQRYDRIFQVDPEGAKRLAWVTLNGNAAPRQGSRMTTPPQTRRVSHQAPEKEAEQVQKLLNAANSGGQADIGAYMAARLKKHFQGG